MAAIVIMEGICAAGVVFMICFLAVLLRGSKRKSACRVVHLSSRHPQTESDAFGLIAEGSGRSDTHRRSRFKVIAGGGKSPVRRVG